MVEINSLEWYKILTHNLEPGKQFNDYDVISVNPRVCRMKDNKEYTLIDRVEEINRDRSIEELLALHKDD